MLTIFATPKPFRGHIKVIQTNAIRSWVKLRPACEVILFGDEEGTAEIASELGIRHIAEVKRNDYGTPLVGAMFDAVQKIASFELICYANSDIIFMEDLTHAIHQIQRRPFLVVGQRWDIDLKELVDFGKPDWEARLRAGVEQAGELHMPYGIDYFVFPRNLYRNIPPFAIGRIGWDNWMIYRARSLKVPVIDGTGVITAIHQNHDYSHLPKGEETLREGPEARRNRELLGGKKHAYTVRDATWVLTARGMQRVSPAALLYRWGLRRLV